MRILLGISIGVWVVRYLGPEDFGSLSYAISFVGLFGMLASLGLDGIVLREFLENKGGEGIIVGTSLSLKIVGFSVAFSAIVLAAQLIDHSVGERVLIGTVALSLLFKVLVVFDQYFKSRVLAKYIVWSNLAALILCSLLRVYFISRGFPSFSFALAVVVDAAIASVLYIYFYFRYGGASVGSWGFDLAMAKKLLLCSWPYIFTGIVVSFYARIDQIMLKNVLGSEAVGYYAAAVQVAESCFVIPFLVATSLFPAVVNAKLSSGRKYLFRMQRLYDLTALFFLGICLFVLFSSDWIIRVLYGEQFAISAQVLPVIILGGFFFVSGSVRSYWLLSENLQRYEIFIHLVGAASNVAFNFVFIKLFGLIGAAYGTLAAHFFTFLFTALTIKKIRPSFVMILRSFANIFAFRFLRRSYYRKE